MRGNLLRVLEGPAVRQIRGEYSEPVERVNKTGGSQIGELVVLKKEFFFYSSSRSARAA